MPKESDKRRYDKRSRDGVCIRCNLPVEGGHKRCPSCQEQQRLFIQSYYLSLKFETFEAYGGPRCACCGEARFEFLTLDHVNNNGAALRKEVGVSGGRLYYAKLRKMGFPEGYQVLCFNCNASKYLYGECPHKKEVGTSLKVVDFPTKLNYVNSQVPIRKYVTDAGFDLFACHDCEIGPHETVKLDCGVSIDIPLGFFGLVVPRSSWRAKGLICQSIYDAQFQGNYQPFTTNVSGITVNISSGERVLQVIPLETPFGGKIKIVEDFPESDRGTAGAGSTGKI